MVKEVKREEQDRAVSGTQLQQSTWHGRTRELPTASRQQPSSYPRKKPVGIESGVAAVSLAALVFSLIIGYVTVSALSTRNGYDEMGISRDIEGLRAETALLRYQIHVAESDANVQEVTADLDMRPVDPLSGVDYVLLPGPEGSEADLEPSPGTQTAHGDSLAARVAEYALGVVTAGGRAEASTVPGHRQ